MIVSRLRLEGFRGRNWDIAFPEKGAVLIGLNGCGKTTILDVLAGLVGNDEATQLIAGEPVRHAEIEVETRTGSRIHKTFGERFSGDEIREWKASLSDDRANYALCDNLDESRYLHGLRDGRVNFLEVNQFIRGNRTGFRQQDFYVDRGRRAGLRDVSDGFYTIMCIGMRVSRPGCPILLDSPERHLDIVARQCLPHLLGDPPGQIIIATHCPFLMESFEKYADAIEIKPF